MTQVQHRDLANAIRVLAMDAVQKANSGHPGMPMGMADVATVLFTQFMKFDAADAHWPDRDRFVLSAGHGSMLMYALTYLCGYPDMTIDQVKNFRQLGAITAGHPEYGHVLGVETTTGPLGQGITNAVGMALAERLLNARYGDDVVDHYTYTIAGDGCLMEGVSQEAISFAGHHKLNKLIVLWDDNEITIDGATSVATSEDQLKRFEASGWATRRIDGHDEMQIADAIKWAQTNGQPTLIACKTTIGYGSPNKQGTAITHGAPLGDDEIAEARKVLDWPHAPFEIPENILQAWRAAGSRGGAERAAWQTRCDAMSDHMRKEFERTVVKRDLPADFDQVIAGARSQLIAEKPTKATRQASQMALEVLYPHLPEMLGGSADLTGSNNTKTKEMVPVTAKDFSGSYVHYGVREHGMGAIMNGVTLHGGFIPYGGTFLVFADYCRPAIRMSALMGIRTVWVMTHDSIGLGEDGPTHQPVEHMPALRAIPNLLVFRPADVVETLEAWALSVSQKKRPSLLALTRQGLPTVRLDDDGENKTAKGAYVLAEADGGSRRATLLASGSEVAIALEARDKLQAEGVPTAVVSMPCWELFEEQDPAYRDQVLGTAPRVAVEAASTFGWTRYVDSENDVVGMRSFGASGPAKELYQHFGITADAVAARVKAKI